MTTTPDEPTPVAAFDGSRSGHVVLMHPADRGWQGDPHRQAVIDEIGFYPPDRDVVQYQGGTDWAALVDRFFESKGIVK